MFAPSPGMPPGIRCIWTLAAAPGPHPAQRVVPDGCVELVLNLGDRFRRISDAGTPALQPAALIVGDARNPIVIEPTGRIDIVAIRFEPGAAAAFLGAPMRELRDHSYDLGDVRPAWRGLLERVADAGGVSARVREAEAMLRAGFDARLAADARTRHAVRMLVTSRGRMRADQVTQTLGVGPRWLQRHFQDAVGFGPKLLARLVRFQALLGTLESAPVAWARAAAGHGYYDQSHLIRDFRDFAGTTPEAFLREPHAMARLFAQP